MEKNMSLLHKSVRRSGMSSVFVVVSVMYAFFLWIWRLILKTRDRSECFFSVPNMFQ